MTDADAKAIEAAIVAAVLAAMQESEQNDAAPETIARRVGEAARRELEKAPRPTPRTTLIATRKGF